MNYSSRPTLVQTSKLLYSGQIIILNSLYSTSRSLIFMAFTDLSKIVIPLKQYAIIIHYTDTHCNVHTYIPNAVPGVSTRPGVEEVPYGTSWAVVGWGAGRPGPGGCGCCWTPRVVRAPGPRTGHHSPPLPAQGWSDRERQPPSCLPRKWCVLRLALISDH